MSTHLTHCQATFQLLAWLVLLALCTSCMHTTPKSNARLEVYNLGLDDFNVFDPTYARTRNIIREFFDTNPNNYLVLSDDPNAKPGKANKPDISEEQKVFDKLALIDQYLRDSHFRNGVDNRGAPIRVVLESGGGPINAGAFWLGRETPDPDFIDPVTALLLSLGTNARPKGHIFLDHRRSPYVMRGTPGTDHYNDFDFIAPGDSMEILAHELGHGIAVNEDKFSFLPCFEAGAAFESFADIFGVMVGADWIIANDHTPNGEAPAQSRNMQAPHLSSGACSMYDNSGGTCSFLPVGTSPSAVNSRHQPMHTSEYRSSRGCQDAVHHNGGILNYAAYLISQGGSYTRDGITINFPGIDPTGVGTTIDRSELERLYYYTITHRHLRKNPDFQAVRSALVTSATDLYAGEQGWKIETVKHAFAAVGIEDGIAPILATGTKLTATPSVSSNVSGSYTHYATDDNPVTAWEPVIGVNSWIQLDLGQVYTLHQARLQWLVTQDRILVESYDIEVSVDGIIWVTATSGTKVENIYGGIDTRVHTLSGHTARYVRLNRITPTLSISGTMRIIEFEVYTP